MASIKTQFEVPGKMKTWAFGVLGLGILFTIIGFFTHSGNDHAGDIFWGTLLYNSIYFTLICNAAMFFICVCTLAMGGWQIVFIRVADAISRMVPIFGTILLIVLLYLIFSGSHIYHWNDPAAVAHDTILQHKVGFLNIPMFVIWSILTVVLWAFLGYRMRKTIDQTDNEKMTKEEGRRYIYKSTVNASLFLVWFALTAGSVTPWLWQMSIDSHWYSTMYSWYTFISSFVAGIALIVLFVIYLKNKGYLELTNQEHMHDLGKFMFAFSIFWTYVWFSQYMLIWYANIPEETVYFKHRVQGPYRGIFYINLIINFVCPILILMTRDSKRNYTIMTFMAVLIIFGHWLDFYQMIMASISKDHVTIGWWDFGIAAIFVGLIIFFVGRFIASKPLVPKYHPFLKESIIHHT